MASRYGTATRERTKLLAALLQTPDEELSTLALAHELKLDLTRLRMLRDILDALGEGLADAGSENYAEKVDRAWSLLCGRNANDARQTSASQPRAMPGQNAAGGLKPQQQSPSPHAAGPGSASATQPAKLESPHAAQDLVSPDDAPDSDAKTTLLEGPDFRRGIMLKRNTEPANPSSSNTADFRKNLMRRPGSGSTNNAPATPQPPKPFEEHSELSLATGQNQVANLDDLTATLSDDDN
jgi:hypothetical protein